MNKTAGVRLAVALAIALAAAAMAPAQNGEPPPPAPLPPPDWAMARMWTPNEALVNWAAVPDAAYYRVTLYFADDTPQMQRSATAVYGSSERTGADTVKTHWRYGLGPWESENLAGACVTAMSDNPARPTECTWAAVRNTQLEQPPPVLPPAPEQRLAVVLDDPSLLVLTWAAVPNVDAYGAKVFLSNQDDPIIVLTGATVHAIAAGGVWQLDFTNLTGVCVFAGKGVEVSECQPAEIRWEITPSPAPVPGSITPTRPVPMPVTPTPAAATPTPPSATADLGPYAYQTPRGELRLRSFAVWW